MTERYKEEETNRGRRERDIFQIMTKKSNPHPHVYASVIGYGSFFKQRGKKKKKIKNCGINYTNFNGNWN